MSNVNIQKWEVGKAIVKFFLPYAMKTLIDRALADVRDGLKPVHRRILFKLYDNKSFPDVERMKSLTVVGDVLTIHGHGDSSVYDAMAKLTEYNESQLHGYIDGEGAFGKKYSSASPADARYTFVRLSKFGMELFKDINKDIVKFIGEKEHRQPLVLPNSFPNILVKQTEGIAVGMSCYFPSFNLIEVCSATKEYIKNPEVDLTQYLQCPDFSSGGQIIYNKKELDNIINTGKGKLRIRSKYRYNPKSNTLEFYEIPHNTTSNTIIKKILDLIKDKATTDILDVKDATGFNKVTNKTELNIYIELKKNANVENVVAFLFKNTTLENPFTASMTCLVNYSPKVLNVKQVLFHWLEFRRECLINSIKHDLDKLNKELHGLKGLEKILLDIDKTISIIRTSKKQDITKNLSSYFNIDETQVNTVRKMLLEDINNDFIIEKIKPIKLLEEKIKNLTDKISDMSKIDEDIINELDRISKIYGQPRKTEILYDVEDLVLTEVIDDYNVMFTCSKDGYLKKIPLTSLRGAGEHLLKEDDYFISSYQGKNTDDVLVFTDVGNIYRLKAHKILDYKVSQLGLYLPSELGLKDESIVNVVTTGYDVKENILTVYENGFISRVNIEAYNLNTKVTKGNVNSKTIAVYKLVEDINLMLLSSEGKLLIFNTLGINPVNSKTAKGVKGMALTDDNVVVGAGINPNNNTELIVNTSKNALKLKIGNTVYYTGSRTNVGIFIYNCRQNKDRVLSMNVLPL
jgi:DNA gyrase/topoisomerase IV subunit A